MGWDGMCSTSCATRQAAAPAGRRSKGQNTAAAARAASSRQQPRQQRQSYGSSISRQADQAAAEAASASAGSSPSSQPLQSGRWMRAQAGSGERGSKHGQGGPGASKHWSKPPAWHSWIQATQAGLLSSAVPAVPCCACCGPSPHRMTWPMPMLNTNGCRQAGACEGAERGAARQGCKSVCHARRRGCHAARVWLGTCKPAEALAPPPHAHLAAVAAAVKLAAIGEGACSARGCGQPALSSRGCCQRAAGPLGSSRLAAAQNGDRASLQYMPLRTAAEPGHDRQGGRAPWCGWPAGLTRVVHGHAVALLGAGAAALLDDLLLQARLQQGGRRAAAAALGYP